VAERRTGLLMDWGGVLTTDLFAAFGAFCAAEGLAPDAIRELFARDPAGRELLADFECGRLADEDFEQRLGALLGVAGSGLIARLFGAAGANHELLDAVAGYRAAGVRTGLLSNSWGPTSYPADQLQRLFDVLVISGEHGVRKPEPAIYALAIERMGLPAEQLVFVDDLRGNLKPARALGVHTIHHADTATTLAELCQVLGEAPAATPPPAASR
jgi:putative hydrolase of the HAD superfamily